MSKKNLPIKMVLQKATDILPNQGGGPAKYFGQVTSALQGEIVAKLEDMLTYYDDVFQESELIPVVGQINVKPEAIAKSHKPNDFCRNCPIIGSGDLDQLYIRVTKQSISDTVALVNNPPSERFRANMTAIADIRPIRAEEKISDNLMQMVQQDAFQHIKGRIKIKLFDFNDDFDNVQVRAYVMKKLAQYGLFDECETIEYGDNIRLIKVKVNSYDDVVRISSISGVKSVDFFQDYSQPISSTMLSEVNGLLERTELIESDVRIGIIDGGISRDNRFLEPYVVAREYYVPEEYRNYDHATFIASTIQYGNVLNDISASDNHAFKFVDIVAIPNSNPQHGKVDSLQEEDLMQIIEEVMEKYSSSTKIWNLSLGVESQICDGNMSDLGIFLDYIQDKYQVQIFVSSGNWNKTPQRTWPPQEELGEQDRIIAPADSVRAITVGSIAYRDSEKSIVKKNEPSSFSRRGPGANYITKPDIVDYGGNIDSDGRISGLAMRGLDKNGNIVEDLGTSYANPRGAAKFAAIYDEMVEKDLLLAKAMLVHSARLNSRELLDESVDKIKYYVFGMPSTDAYDILQCSEDEVTLVFKQRITQGAHLELNNFPYPASLIHNGKCQGEITMTLAYNSPLNSQYGKEYCRTNIDVSFGTYRFDSATGRTAFSGCVPLESTWDEKCERARVENGFKWSPLKSYYRKIKKGIDARDGWKIRVDMTSRNGYSVSSMEFVLIVTIKDPNGNDIYSEVVNGLRERGYITNNLETRQQIRQRQ